MRAGGRALSVVAWLVLGVVAGAIVALIAPLAFGAHPYTVLTGSMRPAIDPGDIVVGKPIAPSDARVGEVVMFPDQERGGELVSHRLERIEVRGSEAVMETRGDANDTVERWSVPLDGEIGQVVYRIPKVGYLLELARKPPGPILLITLPVAILALTRLIAIWRPEPLPTPNTS